MDKNVRKCVLIAGAFATISIGNGKLPILGYPLLDGRQSAPV